MDHRWATNPPGMQTSATSPAAETVIAHIAGIHSPGSRGVVHYLAHHLADLYRETGDESFSLAVRCRLDGLTVTDSEILTGPHPW